VQTGKNNEAGLVLLAAGMVGAGKIMQPVFTFKQPFFANLSLIALGSNT